MIVCFGGANAQSSAALERFGANTHLSDKVSSGESTYMQSRVFDTDTGRLLPKSLGLYTSVAVIVLVPSVGLALFYRRSYR